MTKGGRTGLKRRPIAGAGLAALLFAGPLLAPPPPGNGDSGAMLDAGLDHFYNLEYDAALVQFEKALAADPENLRLRNLLAHSHLFQEMLRLGQLEGNLYDASNAFLREKKPVPDAARVARINELLAAEKQLCEARRAKNPRDLEALYNLGVANGIEANLHFSIEKSWWSALGAAARANELHEKVLKLDPNFHDAKLIVGAYQYVVGSIPRGVKWLAFLFGYRGNKQRGIRLLTEAMEHGRRVNRDATFLLVVVYNRERNYAEARRLLSELAERYPRNPLLPLEIGRAWQREGQLDRAAEQYVAVAEAAEAGRYAREKLPRERLWYQVGVLYQQQQKFNEALGAFARVTERTDSDGLLRAYSSLRRGEIYLAQNQPERARAEYQRAASLPYDEPRRQAQERLRAIGP
jgi:tetratricopeptide (TPR) repeat protein